MKICKKCNKEFKDDENFCNKCGSKLNNLVHKEVNSNKNNRGIWIGLGIFVVVIILFIIINSSINPPVTCNSPYIKVGSSCCLDQDYNGICDSDQPKPTVQQITYRNFKINVFPSTSTYSSRESLPTFANTIYPNYNLMGIVYDSGTKYYGAGEIYVYTDSNEVDQKITCFLKEYYDSSFNGQFTLELNSWKNFVSTRIGYETDKTHSEVRYDYECTGESDGQKQIGSVKLYPVYPSASLP